MLGKTFCDCKPSCTQLTFNVETSHSDFYFREYFKTVHQQYFTDNTYVSQLCSPTIHFCCLHSSSHWSVLEIYFKEEQFITKERNELYGTSDLISNLGGLLGLFTGFSLISLAEIIYFLSLRIFCNDKMYGRWSGPPN
jgi:amiloride-sensitive sodium channel